MPRLRHRSNLGWERKRALPDWVRAKFQWCPCLLLALFTLLAARAQDAPVALFTEATSREAAGEFTAAGAGAFLRVQWARLSDTGVAQLRSPATNAPVRILLNLFSNEQYTAVIDRRSTPDEDRVIGRGRIEGQADSLVLLALSRGALAGSLLIPGHGSFQIQYASNGWQRIGQLNPDQVASCGTKSADDELQWSGSELQPFGSGSFQAAGQPVTNVDVDLLVVYSPAAREGAGGVDGMNALIDVAVAEANTAFENSLVNARLQLVHREEIDYQETGDLYQDLDNLEEDDLLEGDDNGAILAVHDLRRQYRADLVCLITETGGDLLGLANVMHEVDLEFSQKAFSVVQRPFANAYFVLAHEVGHNFGCEHDRATTASPGAFEFSHALLFQVDGLRYHTIMAYQPGLPTPYFSNPDVTFLGVPTGIPEGQTNSANNARTISLTAPTVAQFSSVLRTGTPPSIRLLAPTNGASYIFPASIELSALATDDDGQVVQVAFLVNGRRIGAVSDPDSTLLWTNSPPGTYSLRAVARDNSGWETATPPATVIISPPAPWLDLTGSFFIPDGSFQLRAQGTGGQLFRIDTSTNLVDWWPLLTNTFAGDSFTGTDPEATNTATKFYRLLLTPR